MTKRSKLPRLIERFVSLHEENPEVYAAFERFALEIIASGRTRFGARMIYERLRWFTMVEAGGSAAKGFKLPDFAITFYSRLFMARHPDCDGLFRKHKAEADRLDWNAFIDGRIELVEEMAEGVAEGVEERSAREFREDLAFDTARENRVFGR